MLFNFWMMENKISRRPFFEAIFFKCLHRTLIYRKETPPKVPLFQKAHFWWTGWHNSCNNSTAKRLFQIQILGRSVAFLAVTKNLAVGIESIVYIFDTLASIKLIITRRAMTFVLYIIKLESSIQNFFIVCESFMESNVAIFLWIHIIQSGQQNFFIVRSDEIFRYVFW